MNRFLGALAMTRPHNCLMAAGCVILGGYLSDNRIPDRLLLAAFVAATLMAAATVINDCLDIEPDRINKPNRPLPAKKLSYRLAWTWGTFLGFIGIAVGLSLGGTMAILIPGLAVLAIAYSMLLKGMGILGDIVVSAMTALTLTYGGLAVEDVGPSIVPAVVIFSFMLFREILKDVEDYEGDRKAGTRTVAVAWGKARTLRVFCIGSIFLVGVSLLPWLTGLVTATYLAIMLPTADVVFLASAYVLSFRSSGRSIRLTLRATKLTALVWLIAMFAGAR